MSATDANESLLKRPQAARQLAVALPTLDRIVRRGDLPAIRFGRRAVRFDPADIRAFIARSRETGGD